MDEKQLSKRYETEQTEQIEVGKNAPNNYFKGFLGAVLGGLSGAAAAVLLYVIGFVAGISSFVSFVVGAVLWQKFGGKKNKIMLVAVTATSFALTSAAIVGTYFVHSVIAASQNGLDVNAIEAFALFLHDKDTATMFWLDAALTLVFTAIGCVSEIVKNVQNKRNNKQQSANNTDPENENKK